MRDPVTGLRSLIWVAMTASGREPVTAGDRQATTDARRGGRPVTGYGVVHKRTHPCRPQTNGKAERLNRTPLDGRAYARPYSSNAERTEALTDSLRTHNYHRCPTALDGQPPISRVNDPAGQYSRS